MKARDPNQKRIWPAFKLRRATPEQQEIIYRGNFYYCGGHPTYTKVHSKSLHAPGVEVTTSGVGYVRRVSAFNAEPPQTVFFIQKALIRHVAHSQTSGNTYANPDQFVTVEFEEMGKLSEAKFKAWGMTAQKDGFTFYAAVNGLIHQSDPQSVQGNEERESDPDLLSNLERLSNLRQRGAITDEEFLKLKAKLIEEGLR